jgi:hypothetical protein
LPPSRDDQSAVLRTELDAETAAAGHFGRDHGGATAQELVKDHVTLQRVMEDRAPHALDRLLRAVPGVRSVVRDLPDGGLFVIALPGATRCSTVARRLLFS